MAAASAVAAALLLGACAPGAGQVASAAPTSDAREVTAAPAASAEQADEAGASAFLAEGALDVEAAGARYLDLVAPTNDLLDEFDTAIATSDLPGLREVAGRLARGYENLSVELRRTVWPADVEKPVAALVLELEEEVPAWRAIAEASTDEDTAVALADLPPTGPAASVIRARLGLDGVALD